MGTQAHGRPLAQEPTQEAVGSRKGAFVEGRHPAGSHAAVLRKGQSPAQADPEVGCWPPYPCRGAARSLAAPLFLPGPGVGSAATGITTMCGQLPTPLIWVFPGPEVGVTLTARVGTPQPGALQEQVVLLSVPQFP